MAEIPEVHKENPREELPHVIVYRNALGIYTGAEVDGHVIPATASVNIFAGVRDVTQVSITVLAGEVNFVDVP